MQISNPSGSSFNFPGRADVDDVAVPTSPTSVFSSDCYVLELDIVNPTAGAITVTVTNAAGASWIFQYSINPNGSLMTYRSQIGKKLAGGMMWSASGPGLIGSACVRLVPSA